MVKVVGYILYKHRKPLTVLVTGEYPLYSAYKLRFVTFSNIQVHQGLGFTPLTQCSYYTDIVQLTYDTIQHMLI